MKQRIINWLKKILGITCLEHFVTDLNVASSVNSESIRKIKSLIQVGVDVDLRERGNSWAIVCVAGKP